MRVWNSLKLGAAKNLRGGAARAPEGFWACEGELLIWAGAVALPERAGGRVGCPSGNTNTQGVTSLGGLGLASRRGGGVGDPGASPAMGGLLCPGDVGDYEPQLAGATSRERRLLGPEGGEYQPGGAGLDDPRKW